MPFKRKSVTVSWEFMFTRPLFHTPDMQAQHDLLNEVSALVDASTLRTTLTEVAGPLTWTLPRYGACMPAWKVGARSGRLCWQGSDRRKQGRKGGRALPEPAKGH